MTAQNKMTAAQVAAMLNKKFDDDNPVVVLASDMLDQRQRRMTTGVLALDAALGGGWPVKQWSEVFGNESVGKTALLFLTIAENQRINPDFTVAWVASEEFVPSYAVMYGVDLTRVHIIETNIMEEALDRLLAYIAARAIDLAVIDSLPMLVPAEENLKDVADVQVALQARITGKYFRKVKQAGKRSLVVEDRPVTGIITNQNRSNIGAWAPPGQEALTTPGGKAKNFAYFVRVELAATDKKLHPTKTQQTSKNKTKPVVVGHEVRATVRKNKTAPGERIAVYDLYVDEHPTFSPGSIDRSKDLFMTAMALGVMERRGAYYWFIDGVSEEGEKIARGKEVAFETIEANEELGERILTRCREVMLA